MKSRKHVNADALIQRLRETFQKKTPLPNLSKSKISITDNLMSCFGIFSLKWPSMLQYEKEMGSNATRHNFKTLYGVASAPSDTHMRRVLDEVDPLLVGLAFKKLFALAQRGKDLESYQTLGGKYLISIDGTGMFSSEKIHCDNCCEKHHKNGKVTYHHQLLSAVMVHPDHSPVIPIDIEPIQKQDGLKKNDCERNAVKRLLPRIRRHHPHLGIIIVEDALYSNGVHLKELQALNMDYIIGVKPKDHLFLFDWVKHAEATENRYTNASGKECRYRFVNDVPLNNKHFNMKVNFLEYWEVKKNKTVHFTWITNIKITTSNINALMKGGRARWRIENETFNTLKNQGYNFEHNYGHGHKNLCTVMSTLMMLAFLVDQIQLLGCCLYRSAKQRASTYRALWEQMRTLFIFVQLKTWEYFLTMIATREYDTSQV